jgi:hypothetical protein
MSVFSERDKSRTAGRTGEKRKPLSQFVPHTLELLLSHAWRARPKPLREIIERLEVEHLRHGGKLNGELYVSFGQFETDCKVARRSIRPALEAGVALGLIQIGEKDESYKGDLREPNRYGLLFLPMKGRTNASDEWPHVTKQEADSIVEGFKDSDISRVRYQRRRAA